MLAGTPRIVGGSGGGGSGGLVVGTTTVTGATNGFVLYNNAGVLGAETVSGTGTVTSVSSADGNATVATGTTTAVITIVSAPKLQTARTINGVSFDGTAGITVTAAAGTLTGTTLNPTVVTSSLTALGTVTTGGLGTGATLGSVTVSIASTAVGDIFYAGASNVLTRLADVAAGQPLLSGGATTAPAYAGYTFSGTAAQTYTFPSATATVAGLGTTQTFTGQDTFSNVIYANNAIAAVSNAATVPVTSRLSTVTNNSAATITITLATAGAADGQMVVVRYYDSSAVSQTMTWVNTENSSVTPHATSNGSTTLPTTDGYQFNGATSKWRCIASA